MLTSPVMINPWGVVAAKEREEEKKSMAYKQWRIKRR